MFRTTALVIALTATVVSSVSSLFLPTPEPTVIVGRTDRSRADTHEVRGALESARMPVTRLAEESSGPATVVPLSADEQALVDWAVARFEEAGLPLPDIEVRFDPTRELCRNNEGLYHREPGGPHRVTICTRDSDTFAAQLERRRTLLHELGHVWDTVNLTDDDRDHLGDLLGTRGWYEPDVEWADRGVERFAETFVFSLLDQPARQLKVDLDCHVLLAAFVDATGVRPLGPGLPPCV